MDKKQDNEGKHFLLTSQFLSGMQTAQQELTQPEEEEEESLTLALSSGWTTEDGICNINNIVYEFFLANCLPLDSCDTRLLGRGADKLMI